MRIWMPHLKAVCKRWKGSSSSLIFHLISHHLHIYRHFQELLEECDERDLEKWIAMSEEVTFLLLSPDLFGEGNGTKPMCCLSFLSFFLSSSPFQKKALSLPSLSFSHPSQKGWKPAFSFDFSRVSIQPSRDLLHTYVIPVLFATVLFPQNNVHTTHIPNATIEPLT